MQVQNSTVVSIRYKMMNSKGEVLGDPGSFRSVDYVHGAGSVVPYLEAPLEGTEANEAKTFSVNLNKKEYTFEVLVDDVRWATADEVASGQPAKKDCGCDGACE